MMRYILLLLCCVLLSVHCSAKKDSVEQSARIRISLANAVPGEAFHFADGPAKTHTRDFRRRERLANAFIIPGAVIGGLGLFLAATTYASDQGYDRLFSAFFAEVGLGAGAVIATPGIIIKMRNHRRFK